MYLRLTDDERAVDEVFESFFDKECSIERVRAAEPLGFDADAWGRLAQTGAPGMAVPEIVGGAGADLTTLAVVAAQLGRHIAPVPLLEHAVATRLLAQLDPGHAAVADLVAGERIATVALNGDRLVPAGAVAHVVLASRDGRVVMAEADPPGVAPHNMPSLPLADRSLDAAVPVGDHGWSRAVAEWQALMATALAGLGRRAVEIGVDYVLNRYQFGVPVGSFQGVKHGLATAITGVDGATHLASRAIWALDTDRDDAEPLSAMAFLFAADAAQAATAASLQYHGGYGYAEEYDIQLYYRRAKGWALQYGDPGVEYQRLATELLPGAAT